MPNSIQSEIEYFFHEGKENLEACVRIAFEAATRRDVNKIVMFTGIGAGPKLALQKFRIQPCYQHIKIIAVTFPNGQLFTNAQGESSSSEISLEDRDLFKANEVPIVRAHLPFDPIAAHHRQHGILGQDLTLMGNALRIFCGSMSLCVQAALMACDAGEVAMGEHAIAMSSDTCILVRSAPTDRLLTDFIVREIICKPLRLTIAKREKMITQPTQITIESNTDAPKSLPLPGEKN